MALTFVKVVVTYILRTVYVDSAMLECRSGKCATCNKMRVAGAGAAGGAAGVMGGGVLVTWFHLS